MGEGRHHRPIGERREVIGLPRERLTGTSQWSRLPPASAALLERRKEAPKLLPDHLAATQPLPVWIRIIPTNL
jgi:hypothetical protein